MQTAYPSLGHTIAHKHMAEGPSAITIHPVPASDNYYVKPVSQNHRPESGQSSPTRAKQVQELVVHASEVFLLTHLSPAMPHLW